MNHQRVEIDRRDRGGANGRERLAVGEPAGAEVPSGLSPGPEIAVHLLGRTVRLGRRLDILAIGFVARRGAIVPVPIEENAVGQPDDVAEGGAGREARPAVHPIGVFGLELRQVSGEDRVAVPRGDQFDHQREERRLRAAQVIAAIAVGDVAVAVDQRGEIVERVAGEVEAAVAQKPEHDEIAVPIVDLAEAAARDDIRAIERQQRRPRLDLVGLALERLPGLSDIGAHVLVGPGQVGRENLGRQAEMTIDEGLEIEPRQSLRPIVVRHDLCGRGARRGVGEGLLVGKEAGHLDRAIELAEFDRGRLGPIGRKRPGRNARRQDIEDERDRRSGPA